MTSAGGARRAGRVLAPLGVAVAAFLSIGVGVAAAASDLTVTRADGSNAASSPTTSHTCFKVVGTIPSSLGGTSATLSIIDPAGTSHPAGSATSSATQNAHITFQFATGALSWSNTCSGSGVAPNGTYVAKLSGGVSSSVSFDVAVPPATPQGFAASPDGTVVDFSWQRNAEESDFAGYDIDDSAGHSVTGVLRPSDVCSGTSCSVNVDFGSSALGTSQSFVVTALRSNGSGGQVRSAPSAPATVNFPAPPSPSASPSASGTGTGTTTGTSGGGAAAPSASGGPTGSTAGGSNSRTGTHRTLSGKHPAADLRAYLPSATAANAPDLPSVVTEVQPLPEGTYKPTLAYPDQVQQRAVRKQQVGTASVERDIAQVLDVKPLWRGLAGAALLFLVAAHLRAWLARLDND